MSATKSSADSKTEECLLRGADFLSGSDRSSFEDSKLAWEASTLPLSYTRQNKLHVNSTPRQRKRQGGGIFLSGACNISQGLSSC